MNIQTGFRLILLPAIFGVIGVVAALLLFDDARGIYALLVGCAVGFLATELYIPNLLKQWERTGVPGARTPEQQRLWEQEKSKRQRKQNLVIFGGLIVAALLRIYLEEIQAFIITAILGAIAIYFLRFMWLIYQKRGKLGP